MKMPVQPQTSHPLYIVQGAQWGSEGKGQISAVIASSRQCVAAVRTGSINAGHTVYHDRKEFKMQLIPTAWVVPGAALVLGPGCFIHRDILAREWAMIKAATGEDVRHRLFIDAGCSVHSTGAEVKGKESPRHYEMGATGKGSSEAYVERLMARNNIEQAASNLFASRPVAAHSVADGGDGNDIDFSRCITNTSSFLLSALISLGPVVLEGTQGAHLDLFTGPFPYTTNRPVSTAAWLAYAGLPPTLDIRPILVARTYPIRVAGNSGPMLGEWNWPDFARYLADSTAPHLRSVVPLVSEEALTCYERHLQQKLVNHGVTLDYHHDLWSEQERADHRVALSKAPSEAFAACPLAVRLELTRLFEVTTVTRKIRRIARWNPEVVRQAIAWNGCAELWISFLNYKFPDTWGMTSAPGAGTLAGRWLDEVSQQMKVPVTGISTERYPENHIHLNP